jgi:hypothetical protein
MADTGTCYEFGPAPDGLYRVLSASLYENLKKSV